MVFWDWPYLVGTIKYGRVEGLKKVEKAAAGAARGVALLVTLLL
jgi:hypothetical protein